MQIIFEIQFQQLKKNIILYSLKLMKPFLIGLFVFVSLTILTQYLAYQRYLISQDIEMKKVVHEINTIKDRLKTSLSYSLSATKTLAFLITEYGTPKDFNKISKEILESNKYIDALELTKKGVITHVYPLEGNASAIGFDVLRDSLRNKEAYRAIEKKELYFAGPLELKQGGTAIVGRLPIFVNNNFYGFSAVLIKLSTLLNAAGIDRGQNNEFIYQLSKVNPSTLKEEFFLHPDIIPDKKEQFASMEVPDGEWKIYVKSKQSNKLSFHIIAFSLLGLILSITAGLFAWYLAREPEKLNVLVKEKTLQLAASEKYFRSLIEKSSDAIVLLSDQGKVLYQSASTERISGYSLQEIQMLDGIELIHPDDRENDSAVFAQLIMLPGATLNRTHRFRHKGGHYIWVEGTYTNLLGDDNVKAIVYNYHDITQRVDSEHKVMTVYKEKETTLNRINDSVVSVDNEWRYTFLNDAALATHPEGREKTLGKVLWDVHPKMKGTVIWDRYHEAMQTRKVIELESQYGAPDVWYFAKVYPSADGLTIFYNNITERKKAEGRIASEKFLSESIINSLPGIFYLYDRTGKFMRWNKNFEVVSGYGAEEIDNMHPLDFFYDDEKKLLQEKIEKVFSSGVAEVTANFYTREKKKIPYYFNGYRANFNGIDYLIGMGIDITRLVEVENKLRTRTEEIEELTAHLEGVREEERTRIAREIHDELGQQLTGLKMDASWIGKRIKTEDRSIHEKLFTMISLIDETVKTVRRIASELRPGILDDLGLIPALEWQSQEFKKRTGVQSEFNTHLNDFHPERNLATNIFRVYQEALTNIARHANATSVESVLEQKGNFIWLTIKDNGEGFDLNSVRTKNSLGLIGMKERARMFHGELIIERNNPRGTIIILKTPLVIQAKQVLS